MFALHYFFASETALRHFLTTVAANLRPGASCVVSFRPPSRGSPANVDWHSMHQAATSLECAPMALVSARRFWPRMRAGGRLPPRYSLCLSCRNRVWCLGQRDRCHGKCGSGIASIDGSLTGITSHTYGCRRRRRHRRARHRRARHRRAFCPRRKRLACRGLTNQVFGLKPCVNGRVVGRGECHLLRVQCLDVHVAAMLTRSGLTA